MMEQIANLIREATQERDLKGTRAIITTESTWRATLFALHFADVRQALEKGGTMSKPALTLKVFGVYLFILGLGLILLPNLILPAFGVPPTSEVWIRVVGVLVFNIGIYYWYAAKHEIRIIFLASVYARTFVLVAFVAFAVIGLVSPVLILFGCVDFAGAIWTFAALRTEKQQG
jgi:hypothetical protein